MEIEKYLRKQYIDFTVYNVIPIKKKYGYRIKLIYEDESRIIQKSGYKTKKEANCARDITIAELYNGTFIMENNITVKKYFEYWLEEVKRYEITADSYDAYKNVVYNYINKLIGKIKLANLNSAHIQEFYNKVSSNSHSVAKLSKTVVNSAIIYAIKIKLIGTNPAKDINLPKSVKNSKYRTLEIDVKKTLNEEQIKLLIEKSKNTPIHLQVMFAVLMGLRKSEINGLKYSDIDYIHRTIKVQRQIGKKANTENSELKVGEYTKQEIKVKTFSSNRELKIPDILFEEIIEEKKKYEKNRNRRINDRHNPFKDYGFICCSTYGNPRSKGFHYKYFKQLLKENNLPNIRFHDLRATYCTLLLKNNFSSKAISRLMGHATDIVSIDVYGDNEGLVEDCLNELEPFIEEVLPKEEKMIKDFSTDENIIEAIEDAIENLNIN